MGIGRKLLVYYSFVRRGLASSVGILTMPWTGTKMKRGSIPGKSNYFLDRIWDPPDLNSDGNWDFFLKIKRLDVKLTIHAL
jgi:hypothetical protein